MSGTFVQLTIWSVIIIAIQVLAAIPWLLAVDYRNRERLRQPRLWGQVVLAVLGLGLLFGVYLNTQADAESLTGWGRLFGTVLHLQLAADFFVLVFFLLLTFWPKGGAVALAAFQEGIRQPMYWLLFGVAAFLMAVSPMMPFFTFGEDLKMVKELCFSFTMLAPAAFGVIAAAISVSEEIEGRTAVTLMSKPVSRRQFLLGKFGGIALAALTMTVLLGWLLVWVFIFKTTYDRGLPGIAEAPDPAWVVDGVTNLFGLDIADNLAKGMGFWAHSAAEALPGLVIGFCQVMVLIAVAVALATRLPMIVTLTVCMLVYLLGHLTPVMTEVTRGGLPLIYFVAQLFDTVLPGLDLFDTGSAVIRDLPLPVGEYAVYTTNVALYGITYSAIALLFGLILFEDRDLA
ncbi:MAG: ABC transporter permease [Gemmataceae bacterium]|nr:ABC transporter permease [Gemmataceae bacterium]MCI0742783.1 ABC transporter permease [Gemmataceae bacterium]